MLESAPAADIASGGLTAAVARFYSGSQSEALTRARAAAFAAAPAVPFVDSQLAGTSDGHKVMGMLVYAVMAGTGGGQVIQSAWAYPVEPGENQNVAALGLADLLNGNGSRLEALLPNAVRPDSVFRLTVLISRITVVNGGSAGEVHFLVRPLLIGPDDPDFPNNFRPLNTDYYLTLGAVVSTNASIHFSLPISGAMIASLEGHPMTGRLGMYCRVALQDRPTTEEVRLPIFPSGWGTGDVIIGVEELDPAGFTSTPTPP